MSHYLALFWTEIKTSESLRVRIFNYFLPPSLFWVDACITSSSLELITTFFVWNLRARWNIEKKVFWQLSRNNTKKVPPSSAHVDFSAPAFTLCANTQSFDKKNKVLIDTPDTLTGNIFGSSFGSRRALPNPGMLLSRWRSNERFWWFSLSSDLAGLQICDFVRLTGDSDEVSRICESSLLLDDCMSKLCSDLFGWFSAVIVLDGSVCSAFVALIVDCARSIADSVSRNWVHADWKTSTFGRDSVGCFFLQTQFQSIRI